MKSIIVSLLIVAAIITAISCVDTGLGAQEVQERAPSYRVSANGLYSEYDSNEVAADLKYRGKVVVVSGVVNRIGKGFVGGLYITLGGSGFLDGVQCHFPKGEEASLANLSKGQEVIVKGTVDGQMIFVSVKGCRIQKRIER